ncbi:hypothetical protein D3C80_498840 [compost metagenome]
MLKNAELHNSLEAISRQHIVLKAKFIEFVEHIESSFGEFNPPIKGLSVKRTLDTNHVDIGFVDKTFRLVFSMTTTEQLSHPLGVVRCYSIEEYPEKTLIDTGGFTFMPNGQSNLENPSEEGQLYIHFVGDAINIGLHLVHESWPKSTTVTKIKA